MNQYLATLFALVCVLGAAMAFPYPVAVPDLPHESYKPPVHDHYGKIGRVKIQVYRGPSEKKGYVEHGYGHNKHKEPAYFAPWGYYVTQPEDAKPYGHH